MPETDQKYQIVTNVAQLKKPKPARKEIVVLDNVETESGEPAAFLVYQLTAAEFGKYQKSIRTYDAAGNWTVEDDPTLQNMKLLSFAVRDNKGNRLWQTPKEAIDFLGDYDLGSLTQLLEGYHKANGPVSAEVVEGNSEGTPTES